MVAGVACGIARHFDLDPTLVRIGFGILALLGGIGLAAYAVCALVVPGDGGAPESSGARKAALAVILIAAVVSFPFAGPGFFLVGPGLFVLLAVGALGVLAWRAAGGEMDSRLMRGSLFVLAVAGSLALGVGAAVATAFGAGLPAAIAVVVAGVALVVGGVLGGARWLILPALVMALPVSLVSAADIELKGGAGEREYRPASVSDVRSSYRLGAGRLHVDLRRVEFELGTTTNIKLRVGVGEAALYVPPNVCVATVARVGAGKTHLFSVVNDGVDVDVAQRLEPNGRAPMIHLDARAGVGAVYLGQEPGRYGQEGFNPPGGCAP